MDAVLPLTLRDCERTALILLPSLERHCRDLRHLWVIAPQADLAALRTRIGRSYIELVDENQLVPEFEAHRRLGMPPVSGWYRQQLLKLAAAELVETDFYLTLDADVFAVTTFSFDECFREGRAIRQKDRIEYTPEWLEWAARVLQCPPIDYQPGITPAILARDAVRALGRWIEANVVPSAVRWRIGNLAAHISSALALASWRGRLLASLPWTEYALYDTFLVRHARYEQFHCDPTDTLLLGNNVWQASSFAEWQPRSFDAEAHRLLFNVVQSRAEIPPELVSAKLSASLHDA